MSRCSVFMFFSSIRRHTSCALVAGVQTCALPISPGPGRHVAEAPIVGHWPTALADPLLRHLSDGGERAVRRWSATTGIEAIAAGAPLVNVNTPADQLGSASWRERVCQYG